MGTQTNNFEQQGTSLITPVRKSTPIAAADYADADPANWPAIPRLIHCNVGGSITGFLEGDDTSETARTFVFSTGAYYAYQLKKIVTEDGTVSLLALE